MKYSMAGCAVLLLATFGCGAAEEGENLGESQAALLVDVDDKVLRMNLGGNCIEPYLNGFKTVQCTYPYPYNKKWDFMGDTAGGFRIQNNAGKCITAPFSPWSGIPLVVTSLCSPDSYSKWKVKTGSLEGSVQLYSAEYQNMCISEDAADGSMRLSTCATTWPALERQRLLVDNF